MQILLNDNVTATSKARVLGANQDGVDRFLIDGIFGAVHEAEQIAVVKITEGLDFIFDRNCVTERQDDLCRELEAEIRPRRADMEQHVARGRYRMARPAADDLAEWMEFGGPRIAEQPVPCRRAEAHHA